MINYNTALRIRCYGDYHTLKKKYHPMFFFYIYNSYVFELVLFLNKAQVAQWVKSLDLTVHTSLSPIRREFASSFVNYKKGCTRLTAGSDKIYQLLAQGQWFSAGTPASSTTKTGRHDIPVAEILLKVACFKTPTNQSISQSSWIKIKHFLLDVKQPVDCF